MMSRILSRLAIGVLAIGLVAACGSDKTPEAVQQTPTATLTPTPTPTAAEFPEDGLVQNSLYTSGQVATVKCPLPTAKLATQQAVLGYATAFTGCMDKAWEPVLKRADKLSRPATVKLAVAGMKTACAEFGKKTAARYCDDDWTIYLERSYYIEKQSSRQANAREELQFVLARMYGYHVQEVAAINKPYVARLNAAAAGTAQLLEEQRYELQSRCLAAAFYGANQKTLALDKGFIIYYGVFGFPKHKDDGNQNTWLAKGFVAKAPSGCNTWTASPKQIK